MAKSRHSRKSAAARRYKAARKPAVTTAEAPAAVAAPSQRVAPSKAPTSAARGAAAKVVDLGSEYRYVLGDLKRLGLLAAAMFVTLVIMALVIR